MGCCPVIHTTNEGGGSLRRSKTDVGDSSGEAAKGFPAALKHGALRLNLVRARLKHARGWALLPADSSRLTRLPKLG
ncbi:hypothetical protein EA797_17025 [Stutzerimonas zhaodongensis]|uniref:Uncharacterized protein n=1 Tax=Stutzerimonas zhaodongensis TaxID=1176257 RepID=A0A3M2HKP2_9GAMM|nr:hypothetical protein EA797_17025 [Stutzerimonas zhaodongensis]